MIPGSANNLLMTPPVEGGGDEGGASSTDFTDSSSYEHTLTGYYGASHTTAQKKIGNSAIKFPLEGYDYGYIKADWQSADDFGNGGWTFETWWRPGDIESGTWKTFLQKGGGELGLHYLATDDVFHMSGSNTAGNITIGQWDASSLVDDTWYHIAFVRNGNDCYVYVDGSPLSIVSGVGEEGDLSGHTIINNTEQPYYIGSQSNVVDGHIDEIRLTAGARYTSSFTPSTTAFSSDSNTVILIHSNIIAWTAPAYSCRFAESSSELQLTAGTSTDRTKRTFSTWAKFSDVHPTSANHTLISSDNLSYCYVARTATNFRILEHDGSTVFDVYFEEPHRDPAAWYHFVVIWDTTESTDTDRVKLYVNGRRATNYHSGTVWPDADHETSISESTISVSGYNAFGTLYNPVDGYLYDTHFIDGQAKAASDFAETDASGQWVPKEYTGTYGDNGFNLDFADDSDPGNDISGNNNDFTTTNLATHDQVGDTPVTGKNFCTINPLEDIAGTVSEGNLKLTNASSGNCSIPGTISVGYGSGKWYFELRIPESDGYCGIGVGAGGSEGFSGANNTIGIWQYGGTTSRIYNNNSNTQTVTSPTVSAGDVFGAAIDLSGSNRTIQFYKNGSTYGNSETIPATWPIILPYVGGGSIADDVNHVNFGQDGTFAGNHSGTLVTGGGGEWAYAPPSGYLALCTGNLPTPAVNNQISSEKAFDVSLWEGTGSTHEISTGFSPDLVYIKARDGGGYDPVIFDTIRGTENKLQTDNGAAESDVVGSVTEFIWDDGFEVGNSGLVNSSIFDYVGWSWKAHQSATDENYNAAAGFSIVGYSGTYDTSSYSGDNPQTVSHSLGVAPEMMIIKDRDNYMSWTVYHKDLADDEYLTLDTDGYAEVAMDKEPFDSTDPTNTVFSVGTDEFDSAMADANTSGADYIAYLFASVEGYSKVGSYTGNGDSDGPFVHLGFKPAFVMTKNIVNGGNWMLWDSARSGYNGANKELYPDTTNTEGSVDVDLLSNGFKMRTAGSNANQDGETTIYLAFAEAPFKFSTAR